MTNQSEKQPLHNEQQQNAGKKSSNPSQQGGKNAPGQPGKKPGSQAQPGARQSDQGSGKRQSNQGADTSSERSQRGQTSSQHGSGEQDVDDQSPEMNQAGDNQSGEKLRRGALDTQYEADSLSKSGSTGSDRDTLSGARSKDK